MVNSIEKWIKSIDQWLTLVILTVTPLWVKPNYITLARIAGIYFVWYSYDFSPLAAAIICAVIAITDYIDGRLARGRNLVTRVGKVLDITCDQALLWSTVALLWRKTDILNPYDLWLFCPLAIMFARIVAVTIVRLYYKVKAADVKVLILGRCTTAAFMASLCILLTSTVWASSYLVGAGLLSLAAVCSFISGGQYINQFARWHDQKGGG